jgi:hypothetical protein
VIILWSKYTRCSTPSGELVVRTYSLDGMSDDEIQSVLANQPVSRAFRLIGKRNEKAFPLRAVILTLEVPSLPSRINVGHETATLRPYTRNQMRRFRCQKVGGTQQRCDSNLVCGESGHGEPTPPCVNGSGAHASSDGKSPVFVDEKAVQELRVKDSLSFLDAVLSSWQDE